MLDTRAWQVYARASSECACAVLTALCAVQQKQTVSTCLPARSYAVMDSTELLSCLMVLRSSRCGLSVAVVLRAPERGRSGRHADYTVDVTVTIAGNELACAHLLTTPSACLGLPCAVGIACVHVRMRHTTPSTRIRCCLVPFLASVHFGAPWSSRTLPFLLTMRLRGCVGLNPFPRDKCIVKRRINGKVKSKKGMWAPKDWG